MRGPYTARVVGWLRQKSRRDLGLPAALVFATVALAVTSVLTVRQEGPRRMRIAIETHRAVSAVLAGRMDESVRRLAVGVQSAIEQEQRQRGTLLSALRALEQAHPWAGPLAVAGREPSSAVALPTHTAIALWAAAEREEHQAESASEGRASVRSRGPRCGHARRAARSAERPGAFGAEGGPHRAGARPLRDNSPCSPMKSIARI